MWWIHGVNDVQSSKLYSCCWLLFLSHHITIFFLFLEANYGHGNMGFSSQVRYKSSLFAWIVAIWAGLHCIQVYVLKDILWQTTQIQSIPSNKPSEQGYCFFTVSVIFIHGIQSSVFVVFRVLLFLNRKHWQKIKSVCCKFNVLTSQILSVRLKLFYAFIHTHYSI